MSRDPSPGLYLCFWHLHLMISRIYVVCLCKWNLVRKIRGPLSQTGTLANVRVQGKILTWSYMLSDSRAKCFSMQYNSRIWFREEGMRWLIGPPHWVTSDAGGAKIPLGLSQLSPPNDVCYNVSETTFPNNISYKELDSFIMATYPSWNYKVGVEYFFFACHDESINSWVASLHSEGIRFWQSHAPGRGNKVSTAHKIILKA